MRENLENALRPLLQSMGLVGARGPANKHILLGILVAILVLIFVFIGFINMYEFIFTGTCPLCGKKHE